MSEEIQQQQEQQAQESMQENAETNQETFDVQSLVKRLEQLENTNKRLLTESQGYKNKYREVRDSVEAEKRQKLEESENWKELLDIEKNKSHKIEEDFRNLKKQTLRKSLHLEVAKHASNAFDIGDVINNLPMDMIEVDEENLEFKGVSDAVSLIKEKKSYLFDNGKRHGMTSSRPVGSSGKVSFEEMAKEDQDAEYLKALDSWS